MMQICINMDFYKWFTETTITTLFELEIRQSGRYKMSKIHSVTYLHFVNIVDGLLFQRYVFRDAITFLKTKI